MVAAVLIASLAGTSSSGGPPGPLSLTAPPHYAAQTANCTKMLEKLPVQLGKLDPRVVHTRPETPFVVAWGNPAVVLRCGVDRPKAVHPGSSKQFITGGREGGPYYDVTSSDGTNVWTTVDRAPYISVTIPSTYEGSAVMPPLSRAIGAALPAVCAATPAAGVPTSKLCAERR